MKGVVYRLDCVETGDIYIGSTVSLPQRKRQGWDRQLPETFVVDTPTILEEWDGDFIWELRRREQHYIDKYPCVNRCKAYRTPEQIKEYRLAEYHRNKLSRRANERRKERRFNCEFCDSNIRWDYRHLHYTMLSCIEARKNKPFTKPPNYKSTCSSQYQSIKPTEPLCKTCGSCSS